MDISSLQLFVDVVRRGSYAAVAKERDINPSIISRGIASLEDDLKMRLFSRSTRRLLLTDAGRSYFDSITGILSQLNTARDLAMEHTGAISGTVRLTASVGFGKNFVVPLLREFKELYPGIALDLLLDDANRDLAAENIDLALRLGPPIKSGDFTIKRLMHTAYRVCATPEYLTREGRPETPALLSERECVLIGLPGFNSMWKFRRNGHVEEVPVKGSLVVSQPFAARQCAEAGLGVSLIADWMCDSVIADGTLVDLFPAYDVTATTFDTGAWLVYPTRDQLPLRTRVVIDFLTARIPGHRNAS
jgi:DNA-binding transcriptional LysR family regulator